jgi:hypothetical protein
MAVARLRETQMKAFYSGVLVIVGLGVLPMTAATAHAAGMVGETKNCINLRDIESSPAIDNRTILVKLKGANQFKRIDLAQACQGLTFSGFGQTSPDGKLCKSTPLYVLQTGGQVCMIDNITTIDAAEAATLEKKR